MENPVELTDVKQAEQTIDNTPAIISNGKYMHVFIYFRIKRYQLPLLRNFHVFSRGLQR